MQQEKYVLALASRMLRSTTRTAGTPRTPVGGSWRGVWKYRLNRRRPAITRFVVTTLWRKPTLVFFTGGDLTLTVDGLLLEAEQMITGAPEPEELSYGEGKKVKILKHGIKNNPPYFGVGYIAKYRSDGVDTFVPTVLRKVRFDAPKSAAKTTENSISWQTQALTGKLARDDSSDHDWKWVADDQATEEDAEEILKALLSVEAETEVQA